MSAGLKPAQREKNSPRHNTLRKRACEKYTADKRLLVYENPRSLCSIPVLRRRLSTQRKQPASRDSGGFPPIQLRCNNNEQGAAEPGDVENLRRWLRSWEPERSQPAHRVPGVTLDPARHWSVEGTPSASNVTPVPSCFPSRHCPRYSRPSGHLKVPTPFFRLLSYSPS